MSTQAKVKNNKSKETLDYKEIKTVYTDTEANALLKDGWKFVFTGVAHVDSNGFNAKPTFIMARL